MSSFHCSGEGLGVRSAATLFAIGTFKLQRIIQQLICRHVEDLCHLKDKLSSRLFLPLLNCANTTIAWIFDLLNECSDRHTLTITQRPQFFPKPLHGLPSLVLTSIQCHGILCTIDAQPIWNVPRAVRSSREAPHRRVSAVAGLL